MRERWDMTDQRETEDSSEANDAHDPTDSTEAAEPIDPNDRTDPTEPIESKDPLEQIDRNESVDHSDHLEDDPVGLFTRRSSHRRRPRVLVEDDRLVPVEQDPVGQVGPHGPGEDRGLEVAALAGQIRD